MDNGKKNYLGETGYSITRGTVVVGKDRLSAPAPVNFLIQLPGIEDLMHKIQKVHKKVHKKKKRPEGRFILCFLAEWTGLEPATPGVTGRYSNQLNYHSW